jgi:hypothetical protein
MHGNEDEAALVHQDHNLNSSDVRFGVEFPRWLDAQKRNIAAVRVRLGNGS